MPEETIEALVDGGNASAGSPLGPALGPLGVNAKEVVDKINEKTASFKGMQVKVKVKVDTDTKDYEIMVGSPPASSLIKKELGIEKGAGDKETVGNLSFDQLMKVTEMKKDALLGSDLKAKLNEVLGVARTLGVTAEGKTSAEMVEAINAGEYDKQIAGGVPAETWRVEEAKAEETQPKEEPKPEKPIEEEKTKAPEEVEKPVKQEAPPDETKEVVESKKSKDAEKPADTEKSKETSEESSNKKDTKE